MDEMTEEWRRKAYPSGFDSKDDLDGDGIIDPLEEQIAVVGKQNEI